MTETDHNVSASEVDESISMLEQYLDAEKLAPLLCVLRELSKDPDARHSTLLRKWRKLGNACEQARFRDLFFSLRNEAAGTQQLLDLGAGEQ